MDIRTLLDQLQAEGQITQLLSNPLAQFGPKTARFLGATLLPEKTRPDISNKFREEGVQIRVVAANDAARHSPVQIKGSAQAFSMDVELGNTDIGAHFKGEDYDALLRILARAGAAGVPLAGVNALLSWVDRAILRPLLIRNEIQRWQAMIDCQVIRIGDNNYEETVEFENPDGHRVAAGDAWSDDTYDPYDDITAMIQLMADEGYTVNRIITGTPVLSKLKRNEKMRQRIGRISVAAGTAVGVPGILSTAALNAALAEDELPPIEIYDARWRDQEGGTTPYLARDVMFFAATTGRDENLDLGDENVFNVPNTLGYFSIGTPSGQNKPGRVLKTRVIDDSKPPRIEGEGWGTGFPVPTDPKAMGVITDIE
jgi:hypothetical protein